MPRKKYSGKARRGSTYEKRKSFLRGSFSQNHLRFSQFSRGHQCVGNSICALIYATVKSPDQWTVNDLDNVLISGDAIYNVARSLQVGQPHDHLLATEVTGNINSFGKSYEVLVANEYFGYIHDNSGEIAGLMSLSQALNSCFVTSASAILTISQNSFAVIHEGRYYFLVDSHPRNATGFPATASYGKSIKIRFENINTLIGHVVDLITSLSGDETNPQFDLTTFTINDKTNHTPFAGQCTSDTALLTPEFIKKDSTRKRSLNEYHENKCVQAAKKRCSRKLYESNPEYRQTKQLQYSINMCHPYFRIKHSEATIQRYKNDSSYRENLKQVSKDKYASDPEHRENLKQASKTKYATNSIFREDIKTSIRNRYSHDKSYHSRKNIYQNNLYHKKKESAQFMKKAFDKAISDSPEYICVICNRILFRSGVQSCPPVMKSSIEDIMTLKYYHTCTNGCKHDCQFVNNTEGTYWMCYTCLHKIKNDVTPPERFSNMLDPGAIPECLQSLNSLETHLISRNIQFQKIILLPKGRQLSIKGPVILVRSDINKVTNVLPRGESSNQLLIIKLKRKLEYKGHYELQCVCPDKIYGALDYLISNNPHYHDIEINRDLSWVGLNEQEMSDDNSEEMSDDNIQNDNEASSVREYLTVSENTTNSCLQPIDLGQDFLDRTQLVINIAPAEGSTPKKILDDVANEALTFPTLFPEGVNTFTTERDQRITLNKYLNLRILSADMRFSKSTDYLFFAQYCNELQQVMSAVSIALRKGKNTSLQTMSVQEIVDGGHIDNILQSDRAFRFLKPVRGTPAYWQSSKLDVLAMIRTLGIPTFFVSFSAAEMRWNVIEVILRQHNDTRKPDDLGYEQKCKLIRENPVTVVRMFNHRFHAFVSKVILSESCPIGRVTDYYFRIEFQNRGSSHVHGMIWVKDAPRYGVDSNSSVIDFINKYISCALPTEEDPLYEKVTRLQQHSRSHTRSCWRKGKKECRYQFPRNPSERTFITDPDTSNTQNMSRDDFKKLRNKLSDLSGEESQCSTKELFAELGMTQESLEQACSRHASKHLVTLKRKPSEIWINQYNPVLLECWDANMDIQYIQNAWACCCYVLSYMTKSEKELNRVLQDINSQANITDPGSRHTMQKLGSYYLQNREISAQEAAYRLISGLKLKRCSREVLFLPSGPDPIRISKPVSQLASMYEESPDTSDAPTQVWLNSLYDRYLARPCTELMDGMTYADFCATYRVLYGKELTESDNVIKLQNDLGFMKKRISHNAVIRFHLDSKSIYPERHYRTLIQLYVPHRSDCDLKPAQWQSYEEYATKGFITINGLSQRVADVIDKSKANHIKCDNLENIMRQATLETQQLESAWEALAPGSELSRQEEISDERVQINTDPVERIPDLEPNESFTTEMFPQPVFNHEARSMLATMNAKQQEIFYFVYKWCVDYICGKNPDRIKLCITGSGGVGKSRLIFCISYQCHKMLTEHTNDPLSIKVLLIAPTGIAAHNINGTTIHSALKIPPAHLGGHYVPLGEDKVNTLRVQLRDLEFVVIDEISMVNKMLLHYVDKRLCQIKQSQEPFGSVNVICIGDFYQLAPVKASMLLEAPSWRESFSLTHLTEIMRQKNDKDFALLLDYLRTRRKEDPIPSKYLNMLLSRTHLPFDDDILHIFARNYQVNEHNDKLLKQKCKDIYHIPAQQNNRKNQNASSSSQKKARGMKFTLEEALDLAVGCRVMLIKNVNLIDGLCNGAIGSVKDVSVNRKDEVEIIWIEFDDKMVGRAARQERPHKDNPDLIPVQRSEESVNNTIRHQFPLRLSYACTVHKTQGITVERCAVSFKHIQSPGQAYVALSRVKQLDGLFLIDFDQSAIFCNNKIASLLEAMPALQCSNSCDFEGEFTHTLISFNVENLMNNQAHLYNDIRMWQCDILCLTETHIVSNGNIISKPGYRFFHRSRAECYSKQYNITENGGGVGIFVREDLTAIEFMLNVSNLEVLCLYIPHWGITVTVMYKPPQYKENVFLNCLSECLGKIGKISPFCSKSVVVGDFNIDLIKKSDSKLLDCFQTRGYKQIVQDPTTRRGTMIDHVYIKNMSKAESAILLTYFSYHDAVKVCFDL